MSARRWPFLLLGLGLGLTGGWVVGSRSGFLPARAGAEPSGPPVLPRDWQSYAPVVRRVLPAVVCIESAGTTAPAPWDDPDPGFGSGAIIDPAGFVLTCCHLVLDTESVTVTLHDGRRFSSRDIRRDPKTDLAVVRIDARGPLPFLEFGDSDALEPGDRVLAFGAPFGLTHSVTQGILSAKNRDNLNLNLYEDFLQVDAAVNPGNSGGPLVSMEGRLVGLTSAIKTRGGGFQGVGLAISARLAREVTRQLVADGVVRRPYLGVLVRELDEAAAARNHLKPGAGVVVTKVFEQSPGRRANIGVGDVITRIDGTDVASPRALQRAVLRLPVGREVDVLVVRDGVLYRTRVAAELQPDVIDPAEPAGVPEARLRFADLGLTVAAWAPGGDAGPGLPRPPRGVVVTDVARNSPAERAGLTRGAVIVQVDQYPVATADEFRRAVERAGREKGAVLRVLRPDGEIAFVVLRDS